MTQIETLQRLTEYNEAYRRGEPIVSDSAYDALLETLPENHPFRQKVGFEVDQDGRKQTLPQPMFSMDKCKSIEELIKWSESKNFPKDTEVVITPKFDGLSFLVDMKQKEDGSFDCWTRGNGVEGQYSPYHYAQILNGRSKRSGKFSLTTGYSNNNQSLYVNGEVIMKKSTFQEKYSSDFKNPRNLVAGLLNSKTIDESIQDVMFIMYGSGDDGLEPKTKSLDFLNNINEHKVPYVTVALDKITQEAMDLLYSEWSKEFEIDGLIVEVNDGELRQTLGRERNNNPAFARALKSFAAESRVTKLNDVTFQVSKEGNLCPVGNVEPVDLGGVTISNVTLNNAKFMMENKIWIGSDVEIIRSGDVIPKVIGVVTPIEVELPKECPSCGAMPEWDDTHTHLYCPNTEGCPEQKINKMISFLKILEVEDVAEGTIRMLYESGCTTVEILLKLTKEHLMDLEGFQEKKATKTIENIHAKLNDVPLEKLQHALGMFKGLGSKKLALVNDFDSPDKVPTEEQLLNIEGYSEKSAKVYLDNISAFWERASNLPITIMEKTGPSGTSCEGMVVVFTGVRDKETEAYITDQGGKVGSSVSKKTTHVVCKDPENKTGKVAKAYSLIESGVDIKVYDLETFKEKCGQ